MQKSAVSPIPRNRAFIGCSSSRKGSLFLRMTPRAKMPTRKRERKMQHACMKTIVLAAAAAVALSLGTVSADAKK
jgi:hypothetical protein